MTGKSDQTDRNNRMTGGDCQYQSALPPYECKSRVLVFDVFRQASPDGVRKSSEAVFRRACHAIKELPGLQ